VSGGRQADTLHLTVGKVNLATSATLEATVSPQVDYVTDVLFTGTFSEPGAAVRVERCHRGLASGNARRSRV
jgi:hypothetical protein